MKPQIKKPAPIDARAWRAAPATPADWASIDAEAIREVIAAVGAIGGAVRFGYTRDGGAYALGLYGVEPQPTTLYFRPDEAVEGILRRIAVDVSSV